MVGAIGQPRRQGRANRKKGTDTATTMSELPSSIISDILSRLPLKSILRCRRVSKTWRNLIMESCFPKLHLSKSHPLCLILHRRSDTTNPSHFGILQLDDDDLSTLGRCDVTMKFRSGIHSPRCDLYIVSSCNGLICLSPGGDTAIVCNPITGLHFTLPKPPKKESALPISKYGFGYSPSKGQYKVVKFTLYKPSRPTRASLECYCDIYTLGIDDEWRSIEDTGQAPPIFRSKLVFLNGALHWIGCFHGNDPYTTYHIGYFDIEKEHFGILPFPSQVGNAHMRLGVVNNCLYLCDDESFQSPISIWVMKDCGGSWSLEWVIERPLPHGKDEPVTPIKILKDGTVLMVIDYTMLASYDPKTRVLEEIEYHGVRFWSESVADVPSFLSPMDATQ